MKLKKLLFCILAVCLAVGMLVTGVSAEPIAAGGSCGNNLTWALGEDGFLSITGEGEMTDFTMDENGKSTAPWYEAGIELRSVRIADSITSIGAYAFAGDTTIASLDMAAAKVGNYAFYNCTALANIYGCSNVTDFGDYAFAGCTALASVNVGQASHIGTKAFYGCTSLHDIHIPKTVTAWGTNTFEGSGLSWVDTELGLTSLGENAFQNCSNLTSAAIVNTVTDFGGSSGNVFSNCESLTISAHAGSPAEAYASEKEIPFVALEHYDPINSFSCRYCGITMGTVKNLTWTLDAEGNMRLYGEGAINPYGITWTKYKDQIVTLTIEEGVTGDATGFSDCKNLVSVSLPDTVTSISDFSNCTSLESINIPKSVTEIGAKTFYQCSSLTSIQLPDSVTTLGSNCFAFCENLEEICLPASVKYWGATMFHGCPKLDGLWVDADSSYLANDENGVLFTKDMSLLIDAPDSLAGHYTMPGTVTSVQDSAFWGSDKLTGITLSSALTRISFRMFGDCTSLQTITLPQNISVIDTFAFENCTNLQAIRFTGAAPIEIRDAFSGVTATVYYPLNQDGWTEDMLLDYCGTLTWVPIDDDHDWKEATCTTPMTCSVCGETAGSALGHKYAAVVTDPTCTAAGFTTHTCSACGDSYKDTPVDKLGHTYTDEQDDTCDVCGHNPDSDIAYSPMYRLYNPYTQEHLLTASEEEMDLLISAGWKLDGIAWNAPDSGDPVYRLYNPYDDWHTYSMNQEEIDMLVGLGWKVDGVVCFSAGHENSKPVYRLFNPYEQKNYHLLTASEEERAFLESLGWKLDGIAWNCLAS